LRRLCQEVLMWKCDKCGGNERYRDDRCKGCAKARAVARYYSNKEECKGRARRWKENNRERARASCRKGDRKDWLPGEHERAETLRPTVLVCNCCGSTEPRHKRGWNADHNHTTKKFRAFVCYPCNTAIGHVETFGLDRGKQIEAYLTRHS
jgi:hypothetical protein